MPVFLTFTLYAPIASFGSVAVGERRDGWDRPARSAMMGLVAAALGLDRAAEAEQASLDAGYGLALRADLPGRHFTDYHTTQVPPQRRNRRFRTRADELAVSDLETILSYRSYRSDALFLAGLWARETAPYPLEALAEALRRPAYALALGRRACPLGLPLDPQPIEAPDVLAALAARQVKEPEARLRQLLGARPGPVALDEDGVPEGRTAARTEYRRDLVSSRRRWQFALRAEAVIPAAAGEASS